MPSFPSRRASPLRRAVNREAGGKPGSTWRCKMEMTRLAAIKAYFGTEDHPVTLQELKKLTPEDRDELAEGAAKELGATLIVKK